jgi:hypothetical protein
MATHFLGDTAVLTVRTIRHVTRSPDTIITTVITPIAIMAMLVYVFGGAIGTGSVSYVNYMLPGILLITIASGISYTALRLFTDMQGGIFDRFQSMPIARSSVLWAHVLTSLAANQRVVRLYRVLSELLESDAGDDDPRLEEAADIMAAGLEQAYTAGETYPDQVAHDDLPFRLLDALAVETDPRAQRMLDLMRERGWASWTRLERLAEPPG